MKDPEDFLPNARLSAPSADLDRRMQEMFAGGRKARDSNTSTTMWRWAGIFAAAGIAATFAFVLSRNSPNGASSPPVAAAVYSIESHGLVREMLLEPRGNNQPLSHFSVSVSTD